MDFQALSDQVISMDEAKRKLAKLEEHFPRTQELLYEFGRFLTERLNPELNPMGFVIAYNLALYDLQKGVDGYTGKPIKNQLVGYPSQTFGMLHKYLPRVADAIFPPEFAVSVKTVVDSLAESDPSAAQK